MVDHSNLVELLRRRAGEQPDRLAYAFLKDGEEEEARLSYAELDERAKAIAALLQRHGAAGERVLLLYPPGLDYVAAFFGCLYAGAVAVPTYPPRLNRSLLRLQGIAADARAVVALTVESIRSKLAPMVPHAPELETMEWCTTDALESGLAGEWREPALGTDTLAFLQYTSGSTSTPKGVMVSHSNLLHNERVILAACGHTEDSTFVGWLPLYHDMGLIGNVLQPLFIGAPGILMSPVAFLQSPVRWLRAITRYRAATSGGPNFAYDLCVRRVTPEQRETLDLSSWTTAFNGAEPVRPETLERFADAFRPSGFRREAFYPCYGLAEATLFVTGGRGQAGTSPLTLRREAFERNRVEVAEPGDTAGDTRTLVGCGRTQLGQKVLIADPETLTACPPGRVGEVWVAGESVAGGYWQRPEESAQTFHARLKDTGEGPFLRTGDTGFLHGGELFVTGRIKDLIIIRGRNHYPQDIELTVERSHAALRPGCGAAFSVEDGGEERLVVVQEVQERRLQEPERVLGQIRQAVAEEHELQAHAVVLVSAGEVPKTSSGKIRRGACREQFLRQSLKVVAQWRPGVAEPEGAEQILSALPRDVEEVEAWLRARLSSKLGVRSDSIDLDQPLAHYGIDSLATVELAHAAEAELGATLQLTSFMQAPTLSVLAAWLLADSAAPGQRKGQTPDADRESEQPLSRGQQALFFLYQMDPDSPAYNIANAARVRSEIDVARLRRAFQTLTDRHAALRTTFHIAGGRPVQRVHPRMDVSFEVFDVSPLDEGSLRAALNGEAHRPFDLEQGPPLRVSLFTVSGSEHILLLAVHHIVADLWSLGVLIGELETLYAGGAETGLTPFDFVYADYIRRQEEKLAGPEGERLWSYWRERLSGELPILQLPADKPGQRATAGGAGTELLEISPELTETLKGLSQAHDATLFTTLLAAYYVLLHRYTGQEDILIGTPTAGRGRAELSPLVGYFVNTLPLRLGVTGDSTFEDLLGETRRALMSALDHQEYPLASMVERLRPGRDAGRASLFQTVFVMQQTPPRGRVGLEAFALGREGARLDGPLGLESVALERRAPLFDLTLTVAEVDGRVTASLQYDSDLFAAATARRMLGHYERLLEAIAESPASRVAELPLLTPEELTAIRARARGGRTEYATRTTLHEAFEAQAARTPEADAVVFEGERLSYAKLNARANQLARHLRGRGVRAETPVGVMMERSVDLLVALLGVLKAGGAYVPLDPSYPQERLRWMAEAAGLRVILTSGQHDGGALPGAAAACVNLGDEVIARESGENLTNAALPENTAYVIYTSGSTGTPKGVAVSHRNVLRLFAATRQWFGFSERDVWTLFHSYAFDFSVWELWGALLYGGRLVVVPYLVSRSPEGFRELLLRERVTVLNQTPSAFRQLMRADETAPAGGELSLRLVIFGGEALDPQSLRPWFERHGDSRPQLVNMYGITETTVHVTYRPVTLEDLSGDTSGSPVGVPIPDLTVYVLDGRGQPVPDGVAGELYAGGAGLARGYLQRPGLTAQKFVPDPFSGEPGARLYRSGDLGRVAASGELEYLGRADDQLKVRGFRIEPGEIETALNQHPAVRESAVVARSDTPGGRQLVAYIAARPGEPPDVAGVRRFLKDRLPDYMIPAAFVTLEALPLTVNGKIDRRALPAPEPLRHALSATFVAPRDGAEALLAEVWAEVLGQERVGAHDNFFELGGDSIRSIQVKARARERGLDFSLPQLFQYQTVAELARVAVRTDDGGGQVAATRSPFVLVSDEDRRHLPAGVEDAYPPTKLQLGLIFHSGHSADYETYVTTMHLRARLGVKTLQRAVDQLVAGHEMPRTSFDLSSFSEPLQLVHREVFIPVELGDISHLPGDKQESWLAHWLEEQRRTRVDWTRPPLLRLHVHRRGPDSFQFTLAEPFLDGWSVATLLTELFTTYFSLLGGAGEGAPPPKASVRDYVELERRALASEEARRFWSEKLRDCEPSRLPRSPLAPPPTGPAMVRRLDVPVPEEISDGLHPLAAAVGVPLKSLLLAAHLKVVSFLNGRPDVVTGLLYNGRPEVADGERLLGLFLNAAPLRLRLARGTWADLASEVFEAERELMPYRRYPLAELQRAHGRTPLFDTVFNFTHFHVYQGLQKLDGVEVLDAYASEQTYFDLTAQFNMDHASARPRLRLALDYLATSLAEEQATLIGGYYVKALASMVADPAGRHEYADLLSGEERRHLLSGWNDTAKDYALTGPLHALVEAQAERTPRNVALSFEGEELTYEELNRRANRLAHHLRGAGVSRESVVGVLMERSTEMVVSLLAVIKAGAAYLPLEPGYPEERLAFMLRDAAASVLLTQERWLTSLPQHAARVICVDAGQDSFAKESCENPGCEVGPDNLAYVIYTSGSTGTPKGAMNTHRGIVNRLLWMQDEYRLRETDRVLQKTPFSFDVSVWEFFWPLMTGARLVVARPEGQRDAAYLVRVMRAQAITTAHFVPSMLRAFLEEEGIEGCAHLKRVICSGEALPFDLQRRFFTRLGSAELHNLYGPTEAAVDVTFWRCDPHDERQLVPIGRPISNTEIYLLDEHSQPVPAGVAGELHIAGENLARGYLNRPGLTAERFVPNPFGAVPGERLYRTGDLARYLPGGQLEFLGRLDYQVKIRGFRIELGEIETALVGHPSVREAAVVARRDAKGTQRLTAYVVQAGARPVAIGELRKFLAGKLPDYMVPHEFVALDALPLTSSGKVDRRNLPTPAQPPPRDEQLASLLARLEQLSEAEARAMLSEIRSQKNSGEDASARVT